MLGGSLSFPQSESGLLQFEEVLTREERGGSFSPSQKRIFPFYFFGGDCGSGLRKFSENFGF